MTVHGKEIDVEIIEPAGTGARFELQHDDRRWQVIVNNHGVCDEVGTMWFRR